VFGQQFIITGSMLAKRTEKFVFATLEGNKS